MEGNWHHFTVYVLCVSVKMDRKEKLSFLSFFFQNLCIGSMRVRNDLDHIWCYVIKKKVTQFFFDFWRSLVFWIYIARLWTGSSGNFIAFFNSTMKNVLLSQIVFISYFLAEARLSARARNPRLSDYNSWTSVWSRVQYQRGGLSAGSEWGVKVLRLHPAGAQNPLISSSRPDGWYRREYASLYYVEKKKEKKSSVSFSLDRKSNSQHWDFILELLLTLNLAKCSGGVEDSCTMRVVYCSCLFRIALSEVVAVLLVDLFLPSQARTLAEASKWRLFSW